MAQSESCDWVSRPSGCDVRGETVVHRNVDGSKHRFWCADSHVGWAIRQMDANYPLAEWACRTLNAAVLSRQGDMPGLPPNGQPAERSVHITTIVHA
jgi:hypothetical protein